MSLYEERIKRTKQFTYDRFGMFIHFGIYAIPARGEWVRRNEEMSVEDYQQYFEEFNPIHYQPAKWARLAKEAGMKYAVMTTKHHDGFCLFDSQYTDYKAPNTKAGRDLIKEYVDAFRNEGLKIGFYYSLLDWYHPDYPHYGEQMHPMKNQQKYKNLSHNFENYKKYMYNQVKELMTNYGKIDILWFDFSYNGFRGEKWGATELVKMVRSLQGDIIINNRLVGDGLDGSSALDANPAPYAGDFITPEQHIPPEGIKDTLGRDLPWEACITLNDNWGYVSSDKNYKLAKSVVRMLVESVSKGGNMLLNIGPNAKGEIPKESVAILKQIGSWMHENQDSIYGCSKADFKKPEWGRYTQNGKYLYAHIFEQGLSAFRLEGLGGKIKKARLLSDGSEIKIINNTNDKQPSCDAFIDLGRTNLPDDIDTVVELELLNS